MSPMKVKGFSGEELAYGLDRVFGSRLGLDKTSSLVMSLRTETFITFKGSELASHSSL